MALGFGNTSGGKGYYVTEIDTGDRTLTLSTKQTSTVSPGNPGWKAGHKLYFVNDDRYILTVAENTTSNIVKIECDELPFSSLMSVNAITGNPVDRSIINIDMPNSGAINIGWGAVSVGVQNKSFGSSSYSVGYRNTAAGDFSAAFGQENIAGYNSIVSGVKNKVYGKSSASFGANNEIYGKENLVSGEENVINADRSIVAGSNNEVSKGLNLAVFGSEHTIDGGDGLSLVSGWDNILSGGGYGALIGVRNKNSTGIHNIITGRDNTNNSGDRNIFSGNSNTNDSGSQNAIFGDGNLNSGSNNIVSGLSNNNNGDENIIGGKKNIISGNRNIVQGDSNTTSMGMHGSFIFGNNNEATSNVEGLELVVGNNNTISGGGYGALIGSGNKNIAGNQNIILGNSNTNTSGYRNLISGRSNEIKSGDQNIIAGNSNTVSGGNNAVFGESNTNNSGGKNLISGNSNTNEGSYNLISGAGNSVLGGYNLIQGDSNNVRCLFNNSGNGVYVLGNSNVANSSVEGLELVVGNNNTISGGGYGAIIGSGNKNIAGNQNMIFGRNNTVTSGARNIVSGDKNNVVSGNNSILVGEGLTCRSSNSMHIGKYNNPAANTIFSIGNGSSLESPSNLIHITDNNGDNDIVINSKLKTEGINIINSFETMVYEPGKYITYDEDLPADGKYGFRKYVELTPGALYICTFKVDSGDGPTEKTFRTAIISVPSSYDPLFDNPNSYNKTKKYYPLIIMSNMFFNKDNYTIGKSTVSTVLEADGDRTPDLRITDYRDGTGTLDFYYNAGYTYEPEDIHFYRIV